ncbi:MAG: CoA transferase [Dehalococcoidia bacterium]|nr:CoA transferase [Dehalococcoidia bacterium]
MATPQRLPLAGLKVANFSWIVMGPLTARYLAMWGATVVRLESHHRPDMVRIMNPFKGGVPGVNNNLYFATVNCGALSLTVNLAKPSGKKIALRLAEWCDVMLNSFVPGSMDRLGLDYDQVRKRNPDIIYFSTSLLGDYGPLAKQAGWGYHSAALSGLHYVSGYAGGPPMPYPQAYTDFTAPRFAASAILAALLHRNKTGEGQRIDLSQSEIGCHGMGPAIMDYLANGQEPERQGNHVDFASPHQAYPCAGDDRWCVIVVRTDGEWQALARAMGSPAWAREARFATHQGRKANEDEMDRRIGEWTRRQEAGKVEAMLQQAGIAAGVVNKSSDVPQDAQLRARGFWRELRHDAIGPHLYKGPSFHMSAVADCQRPGPCLGAHNEHVLKDLLELSDDEIGEAFVEGGITTEAELPVQSASST